ncbi:MAG: glycosyltransferase family 4 protein [Anaerolineaceae bacterium]|nr:glycosyltransferase family 4 protein [Anaerolineaceae bacterium]
MRIGIVSGEFPPMTGGVGAFSQILARSMQKAGHTIDIFSDSRAQSEDLSLSGVADSWRAPTLAAIRRWSGRRRLDVVNLQFQTAAFGMSPWVHLLPQALHPTPLVTTFHDLRAPWLFPKAGRLRQASVIWLARHSAAAILTNREDYDRLRGRVQPCELIPIGSNILACRPADFSEMDWRRRKGINDRETLLSWFGLANHSKGLESLLRTFARLRDSGLPLRLVIIGGEAGDSDPGNVRFGERLDDLELRLQLGDVLIRTGFLSSEEVAAWLWASDLAVLPYVDGASFRRGSLMAAIHHGCAILTTQPEVDIPEFVHEKNMWLVPAGDDHALERALERLSQSPAIRDALRCGAMSLAPIFDWDAIACATLGLFRFVVEQRS